MTKILLRKQLAEIFRTYLYDAKKNKARSKGTVIAYFVLFALLMVGLLGGMFTFLAFTLRSTIVSGYGWFYYLIFALAAVCIGAFGSVFNTFSGLYLSRDNDLLLSMPIPVHSIMVSRLLTVFLMGLMYSGVVSIPAAIVYLATAGFSVSALLGAVLFVALIAVFVLVLSCLLGYGVARLSLKLKNKSFMTVIFALLFIAIYYFAYFKAGSFIGEIVANIALYGEDLHAAAPLVFGIGRAFEGDLSSLLLVTLAVAALFALTWYILSAQLSQDRHRDRQDRPEGLPRDAREEKERLFRHARKRVRPLHRQRELYAELRLGYASAAHFGRFAASPRRRYRRNARERVRNERRHAGAAHGGGVSRLLDERYGRAERVARRQDALDLPVAARRRMDGAARQMRRAAPPHRAGCGLCRRMLGDRSSRRICRRTSHGALLRGVCVLLDVFRAVHRSAQRESCLDE